MPDATELALQKIEAALYTAATRRAGQHYQRRAALMRAIDSNLPTEHKDETWRLWKDRPLSG